MKRIPKNVLCSLCMYKPAKENNMQFINYFSTVNCKLLRTNYSRIIFWSCLKAQCFKKKSPTNLLLVFVLKTTGGSGCGGWSQ